MEVRYGIGEGVRSILQHRPKAIKPMLTSVGKKLSGLAAHQPRQSAAAASKIGPQGDLQNSAKACWVCGIDRRLVRKKCLEYQSIPTDSARTLVWSSIESCRDAMFVSSDWKAGHLWLHLGLAASSFRRVSSVVCVRERAGSIRP